MNLQETIQRCHLPLKLDNNTEGYGNCFPNAIVQQCRRPEIKAWIQNKKPRVTVSNHKAIRTKVTNFALRQQSTAIVDLKTHYEKEIQEVEKKSWLEYWHHMATEGIWVDHLFVQMTAWYLELDIQILTTSSKPPNPYILISGNVNKIGNFVSGPPLLIGNYTNVHYQSLLPMNLIIEEEKEPKCTKLKTKTIKLNEKEETEREFIYIQNGEQITFSGIEDRKFQCPFCLKSIVQLFTHINRKNCEVHKIITNKKEFESQLNSYREGFRITNNRKEKQKSDAKLRIERGSQQVKKDQTERKEKNRAKLRVEKGPQHIKKAHNEWKFKRRQAKVNEDPERIRAEERKRKRLSLQKQRKEMWKASTHVSNEWSQNA